MTTYKSKYDARELTEREHEAEELAESFLRNEIRCCQSCLVDELLKRGDIDGFSYEDIQGLYPDPSDWTVEQCREYISDHGGDEPEPNPATMEREECVELLESVSIECRDEETVEVLRAAVEENIDDETLDGLDDWRNAVNDCAEPQEVFEWWLCTEWLAKRLLEIGEPILDNDYGTWWGRTCTGQMILCDGTLQRVAENNLAAIDAMRVSR